VWGCQRESSDSVRELYRENLDLLPLQRKRKKERRKEVLCASARRQRSGTVIYFNLDQKKGVAKHGRASATPTGKKGKGEPMCSNAVKEGFCTKRKGKVLQKETSQHFERKRKDEATFDQGEGERGYFLIPKGERPPRRKKRKNFWDNGRKKKGR